MFRRRLNKRRFPRAAYLCKLVVLRRDSKKIFSTHTENIGVLGICVFLSEPLFKYCNVEVLIYLKDGGPALGCQGRCVWVSKKKLQFETGIEFANLKHADRIRIERIVQACLQKSS